MIFKKKFLICDLTVASAEGATVSIRYEAVYGSKMIPCHLTMNRLAHSMIA